LVRTFASPCFGYEPKVKVTIITPLIFFNKEVGRYEKVIVFFKKNEFTKLISMEKKIPNAPHEFFYQLMHYK
jgi:hypothetical protein